MRLCASLAIGIEQNYSHYKREFLATTFAQTKPELTLHNITDLFNG